jgi:hypothetical protein
MKNELKHQDKLRIAVQYKKKRVHSRAEIIYLRISLRRSP